MALPVHIHRLARRYGIDLTQLRYADSTWAARVQLLATLRPDVVLDIGANTGQFASELRLAGYAGEIISFEPLSDAYEVLAQRAANDRRWQTHQLALGAEAGSALINVAANSMSSSLLSMSAQHRRAAPDSQYIRQEQVNIARADHLDVLGRYQRIFCKIDTQGFEQKVLEGLDSLWPKVIAVQLETSHASLYEGSWGYQEVMEYFDNKGWIPVFIERGFTDAATGRVLQSDWTFADPAVLP